MGLETTDERTQKSTGGKVDRKTFERAIRFLTKAGFPGNAVGVYVLAGLPWQRWEDVKKSIDYLAALGTRVHIAEYTPIPHTPLFEQHKLSARYPIADDPLYQNNGLFPFAWEGFTEEDLLFLKRYAKVKCDSGIHSDDRRSRGV